MKIIISVLLFIGLPIYSSNFWQEIGDSFLAPVKFGKPFLSEIHAPMVKLDIGTTQILNEYNMDGIYSNSTNRNFKTFVHIDVGTEIPFFYFQLSDDKNLALQFPISIHTFEDMFDNITAPIINTDYRFGALIVKFQQQIKENSFLKNIGISWQPWHHESTHLGDEVSLFRERLKLPITRVNVSYEFTELKLTVNDPDGHKDTRHSFRTGAMYRLGDRGYGWFSIIPNVDSTYTGDLGITQSQERFEYYFQYQFQRVDGFLAGPRAMNLFSLEVRNRVKYGVPVFTFKDSVLEVKNQNENRIWCFNGYFGYKFFPSSQEYRSVGFYIHGYLGLNPYGQLRNITNYKSLGFSIVYEPN